MIKKALAYQPAPYRLLMVTDDLAVQQAFSDLLTQTQTACELTLAQSAAEAEARSRFATYDVVLIAVKLPDASGPDLAHLLKQQAHSPQIIMLTSHNQMCSERNDFQPEAYFCLNPVAEPLLTKLILQQALQKIDLLHRLEVYDEQFQEAESFAGLLGKSTAMRKVYRLIQKVAHSTSPVLIVGEVGTGKELVARALYELSPRADQAFVVVHCAALTGARLESELFGYSKGGARGTSLNKMGLLMQANRGTLFLDEIGLMPPAVQIKLVQVLQTGELYPVGAKQPYPVDVRVIAATTRDLPQAIEIDEFREDLYYALNVIGVQMPPLRERREDIPLLSYHFMQQAANRMGHVAKKLSIDALRTLQDYAWPGNVRELENTIERAVALADTETITARDLPASLLRHAFYEKGEAAKAKSYLSLTYREAKDEALADFNRQYIGDLLRYSAGNISLAAEQAGMDRNNFKKIIKRYHINAKAFKKN